jgi:hypothetical protein
MSMMPSTNNQMNGMMPWLLMIEAGMINQWCAITIELWPG